MAKKNMKKLPKGKICNKCGVYNVCNAKECNNCGGTKFAPPWVLLKQLVNRQVSVEITKSNPKYGDIQKRVTLSKWWPGGSASFNIPNISQWEKIENIINNKLAPILGWKSTRELVKIIKSKKEGAKEVKKEIGQLLKDYPDFIKQIVKAVKPKQLAKDDFDNLVTSLGEISDAVTNANVGFREAFISVVKKLPKQGQRALEDLDLLLKGWSLHQITNVAHQVRARIETIKLFEKQIQDERTFELKEDNSIHRILERAMWMIDERYWLMHSNSTLRKFIGKKMSKKDKKRFGKKRPDFVCGTVGDKLIILELKRPSHKLTIDDLNQLETYVLVAEKYKDFRSYEAYLIGNEKDNDLMRIKKYRSSNFKILTYSDIIDNTEKRYCKFLETIQNST